MLIPHTPEEFMGLNPGERLQFARQLGETITPEVVALVIHTYVNTEMADRTRGVYREQLMALIEKVDPIKLIVLADRYLSTSKASPTLRPMHQEMMDVFAAMLEVLCLNRNYIRRDHVSWFCGTAGRRTIAKNARELVNAGVKNEDTILYDATAIRRNRDTGFHEVDMILVPLNNRFPVSLGL